MSSILSTLFSRTPRSSIHFSFTHSSIITRGISVGGPMLKLLYALIFPLPLILDNAEEVAWAADDPPKAPTRVPKNPLYGCQNFRQFSKAENEQRSFPSDEKDTDETGLPCPLKY